MALLSVANLSVEAGGKALLSDVALAVEAGEMLGISGPSGCGKTTLLRTVAGLCGGDRGTVLLEGRAPEEWGWPHYRRRVVYVAQQPALKEGTVRENLALPFSYRTAEGAYNEGKALEMLQSVGLDQSHLEESARILSGGQQQRVCLVRALLLHPAVVLLDEPTSGLDEWTGDAVGALLKREAETRGLAAVVVSHDVGRLDQWCEGRLDMGDFLVKEAAHA